MWTPILKAELQSQILKTETLLVGELWVFWQLIQVEPEKWKEETYGAEGNGFWVVAICGRRIIWYNDIEDGFNIGAYSLYGHINEYGCEQYELNEAVIQLYSLSTVGSAGSTYL
jgi:hypothetical protein